MNEFGMPNPPPLWWDFYWIQGCMLGFEWDWQDGWVTINLFCLKLLFCYK